MIFVLVYDHHYVARLMITGKEKFRMLCTGSSEE